MSEVKEWTCDKCKKAWRSDGDPARNKSPLEPVLLIVGEPKYRRSYTQPSKQNWKAEWCEDCLRAIGIPEPKEDEPAVEVPTLEDMLREIVAEMIDE